MSIQQTESQPRPLKTAAVGIGGITAGLYGIEAIDHVASGALDRDLGLKSHDPGDLWAVFTSPLVHANWEHLLGNTIPLVVLGFLVLLSGWRTFAPVALIGAVGAGLFAWLFSPGHTVTVGASGVIFALLTYLVGRGIYTRKPLHILTGVIVAIGYGGLVWGVLPSTPGVSWQAHLGGAIAGVLAAWVLSDRKGPSTS